MISGRCSPGEGENLMVRSTIVHIAVILVFGSLLGLGFNAARGDVKINLKRNYFRVADTTPSKPESPVRQTSQVEKPRSLPQHPYTLATLAEVIDMAGSKAAFNGEIAFVDARRADEFEEGHLPRAYNIDNYNVDKQLPAVRPYLDTADVIVVYCGGGDCEDSIFLATELEYRGVPRNKLRLFEGGMAAWREADQPIDVGPSSLDPQEPVWSSAAPTDDGVHTP